MPVWRATTPTRDGRAVRVHADAASAPNVATSAPTTELVPAVSAGRRQRARRALELAELHLVARVIADGGIGPWRSQTERRVGTARATFSQRGRLSRGVTAGLMTRDRCWRAVDADLDPGWPEFWLHLSRQALPPYRSEPLFLLGWSAWRLGDVRLARAAVGAALADDPGHRGAQMLLAMLGLRLDPDSVPSLAGACLAGAR
jgi:hypothetical protein